MANLAQVTNNIRDKQDFLNFLKLLVDDLKTDPQEWENKGFELYLESAARWTEEIEIYYQNTN